MVLGLLASTPSCSRISTSARARSEVTSLLRNQQPDGFVAHVTFWQREAYEEMLKTYSIAYRTPYLSDCIQPPVLAEAVEAAARGAGGDDFLREVLPAVRRYFDWLDRVRDPDRDGLVATLQPDESGLDHTPKYDEYLGITGTDLEDFTDAWSRVADPYTEVGRDPEKMFALDRFVVEDCFVNGIYGENQRVLGELLERIGDRAGAEEMRRRAAATTAGLMEKCFDPQRGLFFDAAGLAEKPLAVNTDLQPGADHPRRPAAPRGGRAGRPHHRPGRIRVAVPRALGGHEREGLRARGGRHQARVARAGVDELQLVRLPRPPPPRARGPRAADRGPIRRAHRGVRLPRVLPPVTGEGNGAYDFSWTALALDMLARLEADSGPRQD